MLAGALVHDFDEVIGIENLEGLYLKSLELKDMYYEIYPQHVQSQKSGSYSIPEMKFIHADLTEVSF